MQNSSLVFNIAGLILKIEGGEQTMKALKRLGGFSYFTDSTHAVEFSYCAGYRISLASEDCSFKLLHSFSFEEEETECFFYSNGAIYQFDMVPVNGAPPLSIRYKCGDKVVYATDSSSSTMLRFALWMGYGLVASQNFRIAIHSSVIACQKEDRVKAVLFLGESGTGKSTHTRLWQENVQGSFLLNDDSPIILWDRFIDKIMVSGSPWSGKTPCYKQESYEVAAIVRLSQAPHNKLIKLSTLSALQALYPSCPPAFAHDDFLRGKILDTITKIIERVPIFHLEALPDKEAALTVLGEVEKLF